MKKFILQIVILSLVSLSVFAVEEKTESWWDVTTNTTTDLWNQSKNTVDGWVDTLTAEESTGQLPKLWEDVTPNLDELLALEEQQEQLPETDWFGLDKKENQLAINQLLDNTIQILSDSPNNDIRQRIQLLEAKVTDIHSQIDEYRREQVSAPIKSPWKTTVDDYKEKIKEAQREIETYETEIRQAKMDFGTSLSNMGLSLTPEQIDLLLTSVIGDDLFQSNAVYENVKQISNKLMELTTSSGEDLQITKRYYGMYTILLEILLHMQQNFIENINHQYLPKIDKIVIEVNEVSTITRNLQEQIHDESHKQHLEANLAAQELTLKTADLYRAHLETQKSKIETARDQTMTALQVAKNTYKTVKVSGELVELLRTSQKSFGVLLKVQVPDLLNFENLQMKQEFETLTNQLKQ